MKIPKPILIIIILAFLLRLFFFLNLLGTGNTGSDGIFFTSDGRTFYEVGENVFNGNGFSQSKEAPFEPSAHFPPGYPLLIALSLKVSSSISFLIFLQIILSSLIPLLVWKISKFLTKNKKVQIFASLVSAFEPLSIAWSLLALTEITSVFLLLLAILYFLKYLKEDGGNKSIFLSGLFLGASTLIRPHGQFILYIIILFLIFYAIKEKKFGLYFKNVLFFIIGFYLILSPWLIRNYNQFNSLNVSATGLRNVYTSIVPAIYNLQYDESFEESQERALNEIASKHGINKKDIYDNPVYGDILAKEGFKKVLENPKESIQIFTIALNAFLTQDLYLNQLMRYGLAPKFAYDFSPSVVLMEEGPITLFIKVKESVGFYGLASLSGRIFWVLINLLWILGLIWGIKNRKTREVSIFLGILILYYASTSTIAAFSDHGRFRFPASHFMYILAGFGLLKVYQNKGFLLRIPIIGKIIRFFISFQMPWGVKYNGYKLYGMQLKKLRRPHEEESVKFFKKNLKPGNRVADVGANNGYYSLLFSDLVGEKGKVVSFEPEEISFKRLRKATLGKENITLENKGVYSSSGKQKFYDDRPGMGTNSIMYGENELEIDTVTLKDYPIDFDWAKIDVEGAELEVLRGMPKIPSIIEFSPKNLERIHLRAEDFLKNVRELGYKIYFINKNGGTDYKDDEFLVKEARREAHINLYLKPI